MQSAFELSMERVFKHEGGYVDHSRDPGGATNMGITRRTLAEWRGVAIRDLPKSEVQNLTKKEAKDIYRVRYWDTIRGDELPAGLALAVFDFAVNSGPVRAAKYLQAIVGTPRDGVIGGMTLLAVSRMPTHKIINRLQDERLAFMKRLSTWNDFGRRWARRVADVRRDALGVNGGGSW